MTSEPRRYGFHATIKAPFRLAEDASLSDLSAALAALAHANRPFAAGPLAVSALSLAEGAAFVALTPRAPSTEIAQLEERIVVGLDAFRAPLDESERARRDPARLTERQRETFERWGYPHALAEFRLHFTLTNALVEADRVVAALEREFERAHHAVVPESSTRSRCSSRSPTANLSSTRDFLSATEPGRRRLLPSRARHATRLTADDLVPEPGEDACNIPFAPRGAPPAQACARLSTAAGRSAAPASSNACSPPPSVASSIRRSGKIRSSTSRRCASVRAIGSRPSPRAAATRCPT